MMEAKRSKLITTLTVAPRAAKMAADQNISPSKAGMYNSPPMRRPYFSWKGSSIVKYSFLRMIFAKANPPENQIMKNTGQTFHFSIARLVLGWYKGLLLCMEWFSLDYQQKFALSLVCSFKLSDWFRNFAPLSQPIIKSYAKTSRLAPANVFFDWFMQLSVSSVSFMIGESNSVT